MKDLNSVSERAKGILKNATTIQEVTRDLEVIGLTEVKIYAFEDSGKRCGDALYQGKYVSF